MTYLIKATPGTRNGHLLSDNVHSARPPMGMIQAIPNGHLIVSNNDAVNPDPNQPSGNPQSSLQGWAICEAALG